MNKSCRTLVGLLGSVALVGSFAMTQISAEAEFVTYCRGNGGAVTIPGDLVIPKGAECSLSGTVVQGEVKLQADSDLIVVDGSFEKGVSVGSNAYFDASNTKIAGGIVGRSANGVYLTSTTVGGGYKGAVNSGGTSSGFLYVLAGSQVASVASRQGEIIVEDSSVAKDVKVTGGTYTDLRNSVVGGKLSVTALSDGSAICDSEVLGDAAFSETPGAVQLGGTSPLTTCQASNYFGGNVKINKNTGGVLVVSNIVSGSLSGTENYPGPVGEKNRVRGGSKGQFEVLPPPASEEPAPGGARPETKSAKVDRVASAKADAAQRREAAKADAAKGPALTK